MARDYYEILGLSKSASDSEIKSSYRKLAMKYHPDRNPGDKKAEEKFKEISESYEILKDPQKKAAYDQYGHAAFSQGGGGSPGGGFSGFGTGGFSDIFEDMFGMGSDSRRRSASAGSDLRYDLSISLEDAYNGKKQESIKLIYKGGDILYISIHSLHKITKYKDGSMELKLDKLGSPRWKNLKEKVKRKIKTIAFDLVNLYAKRKIAKGFAFSQDTYLQNELEASFRFKETTDQIKITQEIKNDMENEAPMDRLVCGDVGFGKTEIAIRAAFKAVADNKQVAILVPTTILALQHYNCLLYTSPSPRDQRGSGMPWCG